MSEETAIMLLEHTGYDDFNLEEHQIKGRLEAIKVLINKNQQLKEENEELREEKTSKIILLGKGRLERDKYKEIIEEVREEINYMIGNVDISEIHGIKLLQILDKDKENK